MSGSGAAVFDYAFWVTVYPEFATTTNSTTGQEAFNLATLYLDNTGCSQVPLTDAAGNPLRIRILGMMTAQVAQLLYGSSIQPVSPLVGRVGAATQGSVSLTTELDVPITAAWFAQTKYGLMAWQALAPFRTALYIPARQIPLNQQSYPFQLFGGYFPGGGFNGW